MRTLRNIGTCRFCVLRLSTFRWTYARDTSIVSRLNKYVKDCMRTERFDDGAHEATGQVAIHRLAVVRHWSLPMTEIDGFVGWGLGDANLAAPEYRDGKDRAQYARKDARQR